MPKFLDIFSYVGYYPAQGVYYCVKFLKDFGLPNEYHRTIIFKKGEQVDALKVELLLTNVATSPSYGDTARGTA